MAIIKRPCRKNYYSKFRVDGKQIFVSLGTSDLSTAKILDASLVLAKNGNVVRDRLVSMIDGIIGVNNLSLLPLSSCWDKYISLRSVSLAKETARKRNLSWNKFLFFCSQNYPRVKTLCQVDRHVAFAFTDWLFCSTNKGKTFNNIRGDVVTIVNKLIYHAGLKENVFALTDPASTYDSIHGRAFSSDEVAKILEVASGEYFGACLISLYTGLRFSDISFLMWSNISNDCFVMEPNKTKKHNIIVRIPLHARLQDYLSNLKRRCEYIFPDLHKSYGYGSRRSRFTDILRRAKIDVSKNADSIVSFHSFRHTFATNLAKSGVSKDIRMKLGGWKNESIAEIYNHDTTALFNAIKSLD